MFERTITLEMAKGALSRLTDEETNIIINVIERTGMMYLNSGVEVDVPYFFWSIHKDVFAKVDPTEYLSIKDSINFGIQTVFYFSLYIEFKRGDK